MLIKNLKEHWLGLPIWTRFIITLVLFPLILVGFFVGIFVMLCIVAPIADLMDSIDNWAKKEG